MNETIKSIIEIIKSCEDVQLCTNRSDGYPETRHVMNGMNQNIETIDLRFLTIKDSPKYLQLQKNNNCCLYYFNPDNRHAVRLFGQMENIDDQNEKNKYWKDKYSRFGFTGPEDSNFALLHFIPQVYKFYIGEDMYTGNINQ